MRKYTFLFSSWLLFWMGSTLQANELSFVQLAELSTSPDILNGLFVQTKYISDFDAELLSNGTFTFEKGKNISWVTLEPIETELFMTRSSIINRQDGVEVGRLDARQNPIVGILSNVFFAVMSAQWTELERYFELQAHGNGTTWEAKLKPLDAVVRQAISSVELKGDTLLREVLLHESNGDSIRIVFELPQS